MFNVEEIIRNADLVQLVERAGGHVDKGRSHCPLHGGRNSNGFAIFQKDGREYWKCHSGDCGGGDVINFVEVWQGLDFKGACQFLGGNVQGDPVEMQRLAQARFERSKIEHEEARLKMEARRHELQIAKRHVWYHETMQEWARLEWVRRGIDESWQGFWTLGACDDKTIKHKGEEYHTPTLTIPIVDGQYNLLNIKHRLINPPSPKDKYRPEREGLGAFPMFYAFPDLAHNAESIWIVEGEIKAMVTATITPDASWQFIGLPGQDYLEKLPLELTGKKVYIVSDPGAEAKAWKAAKRIGARMIAPPHKIDDMILENELSRDWLNAMAKQARIAK